MGSAKAPDAPKTDYKGDINSFVSGLQGAFPKVLGIEDKYRDKFQGLNLGDVSSLLGGIKGQDGLTSIAGKLSKTAGSQIGDARAADLAQMTTQTGLTRGLLQNLSPESASMVNQAQQQAITAQNAAQGLTPSETRTAQQFAREGAADRGRTFDNTGIAAEVLNRDSILGQKRQEAAAATTNAYNLSNSFYSSPGLNALSATRRPIRLGRTTSTSGFPASARPGRSSWTSARASTSARQTARTSSTRIPPTRRSNPRTRTPRFPPVPAWPSRRFPRFPTAA